MAGGGRRARRLAAEHPRELAGVGRSAFPARCTRPSCSTPPTGRCGRRSCGTTVGPRPRSGRWGRAPELARVAGVPAMVGFTAPKLLWLARHEPVCSRARARCSCPRTMCGCAWPASAPPTLGCRRHLLARPGAARLDRARRSPRRHRPGVLPRLVGGHRGRRAGPPPIGRAWACLRRRGRRRRGG